MHSDNRPCRKLCLPCVYIRLVKYPPAITGDFHPYRFANAPHRLMHATSLERDWSGHARHCKDVDLSEIIPARFVSSFHAIMRYVVSVFAHHSRVAGASRAIFGAAGPVISGRPIHPADSPGRFTWPVHGCLPVLSSAPLFVNCRSGASILRWRPMAGSVPARFGAAVTPCWRAFPGVMFQCHVPVPCPAIFRAGCPALPCGCPPRSVIRPLHSLFPRPAGHRRSRRP